MAELVISHPVNEDDAGFKAAEAWFFANEVEKEEGEEKLAKEIGRRLGINPQILRGKMHHLREQLDTVEMLADAKNWGNEMREIERDRVFDLGVEQLRMIPWIEKAIMGATRKPDLLALALAELPEAQSAAKKGNAALKKGSVVSEMKRLLQEKHDLPVSKERIARLRIDFVSRD
jgi:hypothetical protein